MFPLALVLVLFGGGLILWVIGVIWSYVVARRDSTWLGFLTLIVWPVGIILLGARNWSRAKWPTVTSLVGIAALGLAGLSLLVSAGREMAEARVWVDEFHRKYVAGDYMAIYDASHSTLREATSSDETARQFTDMRDKLGDVVTVSDACWVGVTKSAVKTIRVEYLVTFNRGEAWETFDWRSDGADMRLLAYAVETGLEDGKADWELYVAPRGIRPQDTTCGGAGEPVIWWEH